MRIQVALETEARFDIVVMLRNHGDRCLEFDDWTLTPLDDIITVLELDIMVIARV